MSVQDELRAQRRHEQSAVATRAALLLGKLDENARARRAREGVAAMGQPRRLLRHTINGRARSTRSACDAPERFEQPLAVRRDSYAPGAAKEHFRPRARAAGGAHQRVQAAELLQLLRFPCHDF